MPPVGAAIATAIGLGGSALAGTLITGAIEIAASVGLSYVAQALADKPPASATETAGFVARLQGGATRPRSFGIGTFATAGSLGYAGTWGNSGKTPNAYYVQRIDLSDLPVEGMIGLFVNGQRATFDPSAAQSGNGYAVPDYIVNGVAYLWVRFHDGRQVAVDDYLVSKFGADPNYPYTTDMVGQGVAYAVVTCLINDQLFASEPEFLFEMNGLRLYDIRKDTSVGGSGAHRWANQATWQFTDNPAIILYNLLRSFTWSGNGKWLYGLQSTAAANLPFSEWVAAINACATLLSGTATYRCGGEIFVNTEPGDEVDALLKAMNARLAEIGGTYKIHVGAAGASVMSFTDASILSTEEQVYTPFDSLDNTVNGITAKFISPADGWTSKDAPPRYSTTYETEEGGRRVVADIDYGRVPYPNQVQRLMKAALLEARRARKHVVVLPPSAWVLEPLDFVSWTSTRNGYSSKLFRVDRIDDKDNLDVVLYLTEVDPTDYSWTDGADLLTTTSTTVTTLRPAAQAIAGWSVSPIKLTGTTGSERAAIRLGWGLGMDDVDGVRYQVRLAATQALALAGETDFFDLGTLDISQNIIAETNYEARGQFRSKSGRAMTWSSWLPVTTMSVAVDSNVNTLVFLEQQARIQQDGVIGDAASVAQQIANQASASGMVKIDLFEDTATYTRWGVYLNVGTAAAVNWKPSGFFIDKNKATGLSRAFFDVDLFAIGKTGATGALASPFTVAAGIVLIKNAAIQNLAVGNIVTGGLSDVRAVTNRANIVHSAAGTYQYGSMSFSGVGGRGKFLFETSFFTQVNPSSATGISLDCQLWVTVNGGAKVVLDRCTRSGNFSNSAILPGVKTQFTSKVLYAAASNVSSLVFGLQAVKSGAAVLFAVSDVTMSVIQFKD